MNESKKKDKYYCYDCNLDNNKTEIKLDKNENIVNGQMLIYDVDEEKRIIFKCLDCLKKYGKELRQYQECEVYSRIVGYLRPIKQWHKGKQEEYGERKNFVM